MKSKSYLYLYSFLSFITILFIALTLNARKGELHNIDTHILLTDSMKSHSILNARNVFFTNEETDSVAEVATEMITYAKSFMGIPYYYTGKNPNTGFDCSGFTSFIYQKFGFEVSPASREQENAGTHINIEDVRKGDLLIFTGTNISRREPGHVGIIVSKKGERPIRFIHSSSSKTHNGVTISTLEDGKYQERLLQVRRILPY